MTSLELSDFNEIRLDDRAIIQQHIFKQNRKSCELNFCNIFNWSSSYQYRWQQHKDHLLITLLDGNDILFPCGEFLPPEELAILADTFIAAGKKGMIFDVPPEYLVAHPDVDEHFELNSSEGSWDYIYSTEKMHVLSGKKLRKKRNHISQFEREYPGWQTVELNDDSVGEFERFIQRIYADMELSDMLAEDYLALETALKFYAYTGLEGLALDTGDGIAAISLFSRQSADTYTIHFEKTDKNVKGASQMINRETAGLLRDKCEYLNREQDLGIPGLRRAKRSYAPEFQLKNYSLKRKK